MMIAEELPDDYFTPTIADLQARQHHLHARAVALNNSPLVTRAQREEQTKMKRDRWPNVHISFLPPPPLSLGKLELYVNERRRLVLAYSRRSGCAFQTARSLRRCSRRAARSAPYIHSCEILCVRTSSLSNSFYVCVSGQTIVPFYLSIRLSVWNSHLFPPNYSVQSTTARSESLGSRRARSHPSRTGARTLLNPASPIRRRRTQPCVTLFLSDLLSL